MSVQGLLRDSGSGRSISDVSVEPGSNDADAVARGLLGPTNWYMRHRDDRAANRVLSRRKDVSADVRAPRMTAISMADQQ